MKTAFVKILTCVVVYVFTFGVLLNCLGDIPTALAGAPPQGNWISVPAGTRILIRVGETLSSSNQRVGARFTGRLETNLMAQGIVAAPRGATVHGQVVSAQSAGRMSGGSELALELTDIVVNDTAHPIVTNTYQLQGQGQGGRTARNVATGAGLGTAIGAIAGGGRGALIGAAGGGALGTARAAGGGGGQQANLTQGTMLEFRLQQPASLPRPR
ncbi:MAG TPA: hypothetical protein VHM93_23875 [Candidatus Acidoferrum sp.]|jgi:hypothetical protein|nr:hypothetical protein [Candidatus Acidoferrum sp.]